MRAVSARAASLKIEEAERPDPGVCEFGPVRGEWTAFFIGIDRIGAARHSRNRCVLGRSRAGGTGKQQDGQEKGRLHDGLHENPVWAAIFCAAALNSG